MFQHTNPIDLVCLACNYQFELASETNDKQIPPEAGALSMCINCGNVDIFTEEDGKLGLRAPNPDELEGINANPDVRQAREWLAARKPLRDVLRRVQELIDHEETVMKMHKCFTPDAPDGWIDCMCPIGRDHDEDAMEGGTHPDD